MLDKCACTNVHAITVLWRLLGYREIPFAFLVSITWYNVQKIKLNWVSDHKQFGRRLCPFKLKKANINNWCHYWGAPTLIDHSGVRLYDNFSKTYVILFDRISRYQQQKSFFCIFLVMLFSSNCFHENNYFRFAVSTVFLSKCDPYLGISFIHLIIRHFRCVLPLPLLHLYWHQEKAAFIISIFRVNTHGWRKKVIKMINLD